MRLRSDLRTPYLLLLALLIGGPLAAMLPLFVSWLPAQIRAARLKSNVETLSARIASDSREVLALRATIEIARREHADGQDVATARWLSHRDDRSIFEHCAAALSGAPVTVKRLTLEPPHLFAGESRANLLAADRVEAVCSGDYAGLTIYLDALAEAAIPLRCSELTWKRQGREQELRLTLDAPFVPDAALAAELAERSDLQ